ncbi:MAG: hypothetical protein AAF651_00480, partial [Cyanobacteria bacterium P01_C01_bin.73]
MVTLTVGAMTYRSFSRSEQAIAKREQQVINNSATPAIDRAKAKLEYLFQQDTRMTGVPPSDQLIGMLLNTSYNSVSVTPLGTGVTTDPYTLPDETRLDINNDGNDDNAWSFPSDINGDGTIDPTEYVVYSVLLDDQQDLGGTTYSITDTPNLSKAKSLVTRTGPINTTEAGTQCASARAPEGGWQVVGSSNSDLEKNFQVDVLAVNGNPVNRTVETLEFQQSRRAERGNKWGAWFRYDMIADPESTSTFNWNGAMHTEGSFFFNGPFKMHMISSDHSCLYNEPASEMTMREADAGSDAVGGSGRPAFQGQLVNGNYDGYKSTGDTDAELALMPAIHVFDTDDTPAIPFEDNAAASNADNRKVGLYNGDKSSVKRNAFSLPPVSVGLNPVALFTEEVLEHNVQPGGSSWERRPGYENSIIGQRVLNDNDPRVPNLDDFYRADNRWGPKPRYGSTASMADAGTSLGQNITGNSALTNATTGADGYWERRAIATGLRLIVGQRLELGNAFGWRGDNDPLYPTVNAATGAVDPTGTSYQVAGPGAGGSFKPGLHEMLQFNTLRDNLAAVQGMVIYHYKNAAGTPVACVALTAHPGTQDTIANSRTFGLYTSGSGNLKVDFLSGKGTNGWEFSPPDITDAEVGKALKNLATFAGDPEGGSPSFPPAEDSEVHPAPFMSMWGDFSILERGMLSASAADVSTRESSACTLGMLAYNIQTLDKEVNGVASGTPSVPTVQAIQAELGEQLTDRVIDNANFPTFTLADAPKRSLEEWMGALDDSNGLIDGTYTKAQLMEYFVAASQWYQVQRDRTNGFAVELSTNYPFSATASAPYAANAPYPAMCDPNAEFSGVSDEADRFSLAIALCPPTEEDTANNIYQVRYPALYYVFPLVDHGLDDGSGSKYVSNGQVQTAVGGGATAFQAVNLGNVELQPLDIDSSNPSVDDWTLPVASVSPIDGTGFIDASPADLDSEAIRIDYTGTLYKVPFADKGMFDGRENMSLRVLDVDLELLTKNQYSG